jgi:hypothetical protein
MTNNKQQTALSFFLMGLIDLEIGKGISTDKVIELHYLFDKAKEMEKERIETAFNSGYNNGGLDTCLTPKQYYEQTYGGGEQ